MKDVTMSSLLVSFQYAYILRSDTMWGDASCHSLKGMIDRFILLPKDMFPLRCCVFVINFILSIPRRRLTKFRIVDKYHRLIYIALFIY